MNILITNDDGIGAEGIRHIVMALAENHRVFVAAPEVQQSAKARSITMNLPLFAHEVNAFKHPNIIRQWAISGTPADCVKIAVEELMDEPIDLIVSGINHGPNYAEDVLYSGTVGAALEGSLYDLPAIALSMDDWSNYHFSHAARYVAEHLDGMVSMFEDSSHILNVNFPNKNHYEGSRMTHLGSIRYVDIFTKRVNPHGRDYYWIAGDKVVVDGKNDANSDIVTVQNGYVSISSIRVTFEHIKKRPDDLETWK